MSGKKIEEREVLIPICFGEIKTGAIDEPAREIKILLDSGASGSITEPRLVLSQKIVAKKEGCGPPEGSSIMPVPGST